MTSAGNFSITANRVDVLGGTISPATVVVHNGIIQEIRPAEGQDCSGYLIPGFVDSHIHIESSMLLPSQFAAAAVVHGTVATVSDPHEIANVCGLAGIELMLDNAAQTNFKFNFGAPSCVPATRFETAGAELDAAAVAKLLDDPRLGYLSEVMNFPGVLNRDAEVMAKIAAAKARNKPIDGHAPGLRGDDARRYVSAGITTDHECTTRAEAEDKLAAGCKIAIREGSAARNFAALESLIDDYPDEVMLCSDDKHPDELLLGHINLLAARALANGHDLMKVLRACSVNAVKHYRMNVGLLQIGDPADFVLVHDLQHFHVCETYINGACVARNGESLLAEVEPLTINRFGADPIDSVDLVVAAKSNQIRLIEVIEGQLITGSSVGPARIEQGNVMADPVHDILKLVVVNRYQPARPAVAFVRGFGLKRGAIASSVAHDSHNIIAVGATDSDLVHAINAVIDHSGGLSVATEQAIEILPLPVAGLMSTHSCQSVGETYHVLDQEAKKLGCQLRAPFMTLSFLALPVIPALKLSDQGLFDVDKFEFVELFR